MLLDTLKLLAFEGMDVKINKFDDSIHICSSKVENITKDRKNMFKITAIRTELTLDGEIIQSRVFENFRADMNSEATPGIYGKFPSYNYFNNIPLCCSEEIQKSMEICSCDIPTLDSEYSINIDRFGQINKVHH
jgi:hypothetical protein